MEKVMTIREIESRFKSEWILLEQPKTNEALEVLKGKVVCHSMDRDEVYRAAVSRKPRRFAILFTGKPPKDRAIVLWAHSAAPQGRPISAQGDSPGKEGQPGILAALKGRPKVLGRSQKFGERKFCEDQSILEPPGALKW